MTPILTTELTYAAEGVAHRRVAEPPPDPLSEAELALIWAGQRFPPGALRTPEGKTVEVVFPGRHGGSAGPDFRDAVVRLDGRERRGDVELHVRASSFRGHGHHLDPAYDAVVLHVVYLADDGVTTRLSSGAVAPVAAFEPWLARRQTELAGWLSGPALWQEPCQTAVARLGETEVRQALAASGAGRFAARVAAMQAAASTLGEDEALWRALLDVHSYGGDRAAFRRLATAFPSTLARSLRAGLPAAEARPLLTSALLAVAGLSPSPAGLAGPLPPPIWPPPRRAARPAGRPEKRLAAFAALCARADADFVGYVLASVAAAAKASDLVAAWQAPGTGRERASEIVFNAVLPFAALRPALAPRARELAAALPAQRPYGKTAFLERNLRRPDGRRLVRTAQEQQGLLALLAGWCSRGGCGRCPLS